MPRECLGGVGGASGRRHTEDEEHDGGEEARGDEQVSLAELEGAEEAVGGEGEEAEEAKRGEGHRAVLSAIEPGASEL